MPSDLYEQENYLTPDKYVSGHIVEYDMEKANINMLLKANVIDQNYYNFLYYLLLNYHLMIIY